jgi:hypothetical protein
MSGRRERLPDPLLLRFDEMCEPTRVEDAPELPDDADPELWFDCCHHAGGRDYLLQHPWHTFPGRMSAWCATRRVSFRVSKSELPKDLPAATNYWVQGFLVGNVPHQPVTDDFDGPAVAAWRAKADRFLAGGYWPPVLGSEQQRQWWDDAQVLVELGRTFAGTAMPVVEVRIPKDLAQQALAAWRRDDDEPDAGESQEQRVYRHRAGVLALIGLSIHERGKEVADAVIVDLGADLITAAVDATEDP